MADNNATGYQYTEPPVPSGWNAQERRYHMALMELFDRLFTMKFGSTRLKKNCIQANHLSLSVLEDADFSSNTSLNQAIGTAIEPLITYSDAENLLLQAGEGITIDGQLVRYAAKTDLDGAVQELTTLKQGTDQLTITVQKLADDIGTHFHFTEDGLEIGKDGEEYHTETKPTGFYIVKGSGDNKLYMVSVTADETKMPAVRAEEHLYIGKPEDGCLEWYRCYNGYGLRRVQPIVEGSGE